MEKASSLLFLICGITALIGFSMPFTFDWTGWDFIGLQTKATRDAGIALLISCLLFVVSAFLTVVFSLKSGSSLAVVRRLSLVGLLGATSAGVAALAVRNSISFEVET